jgi:hypothetical protein
MVFEIHELVRILRRLRQHPLLGTVKIGIPVRIKQDQSWFIFEAEPATNDGVFTPSGWRLELAELNGPADLGAPLEHHGRGHVVAHRVPILMMGGS